MGNRACLCANKFVEKDGTEFHGYRLYDDYGTTYNNCMDETAFHLDDLEFLKCVVSEGYMDEMASDVFDNIIEMETGIEINNTYYEYAEIKDYIKA
jgi:hypothetical protein